MALVSCKECKKKVSSEAATCPHCGIANPAGLSDALLDQDGKLKKLTSKEFKKLSLKDRAAYRKAGGKYEETLGDKLNVIVALCIAAFIFILMMKACSGGGSDDSDVVKTPEQVAEDKVTNEMFGLCQLAVKRIQPKSEIKYGKETFVPRKNAKGQWETAIAWTALNAYGVTAENQTVCVFDKKGIKILSVKTTNLGFEK